LAGLCPKIWVFEGRFLPSWEILGRTARIIYLLQIIHKIEKNLKLKITILESHVITYVRICVLEAQKFVHLRPILADFPDTKHQELPGASSDAGNLVYWELVSRMVRRTCPPDSGYQPIV
jgi:hypothetical protein